MDAPSKWLKGRDRPLKVQGVPPCSGGSRRPLRGGFAGLDPPCARRLTGRVGTKGVPVVSTALRGVEQRAEERRRCLPALVSGVLRGGVHERRFAKLERR
ncbi:MAG: hypothetical protein AVDCRST_MAG93-8886 [uncultured Chloroflexia bacterium]|uniref:Uncharacterized protein n=1 Tax=uncultured Chloroflexia bacterium TaxID=1672391 RepID=A0A6J4N434_9CHLR|nr:MAG: hypothetical protein AVDCRST_MAG93-8886 [uncultured Chloroflexia bacterium]